MMWPVTTIAYLVLVEWYDSHVMVVYSRDCIDLFLHNTKTMYPLSYYIPVLISILLSIGICMLCMLPPPIASFNDLFVSGHLLVYIHNLLCLLYCIYAFYSHSTGMKTSSHGALLYMLHALLSMYTVLTLFLSSIYRCYPPAGWRRYVSCICIHHQTRRCPDTDNIE